ncbi:TIGR00730 family Rossman fold protein [Dyadobacter chenwenxiniae]|uniref:Cytokinin riboside 5'-monophosphate phosphoribohydrolase n=1 Tax=Dyadobacter chenwenxiniae TaxID=2906456 RepID=A0A9X1TEV6_9BACT|nr:TIGR00730 family Rossman fold protein [Dyadobacter chenwenxiniae]MCF0049439.1 TIGR00730 family Rossman fold protein [Dyadobacter chenwenxiniae]MCF0061915.1 TIGR00730 family Rossman fold protein [Dyadobacter chenwenxiniae]UON81729.1 TIGR00730 family Rossman fold protein [Dyadobacter chenwenxiniae]
MQSIVVYCGSNPGKKPIYAETAYALGAELAKRNIRLIYGGGNMGLMGRVADGAMENNGSVTGIIPNFLAKLEVAHKTLTEIHFTETMHERKAKMASITDGVIALPGGYGTFDELFEILTWSQLKIFKGPVGLLNVNGFYDLMLLQLDKMVEEGFLHPDNQKLLVVADNVSGLLEKMEAFRVGNTENKPLDKSLYVDNN